VNVELTIDYTDYADYDEWHRFRQHHHDLRSAVCLPALGDVLLLILVEANLAIILVQCFHYLSRADAVGKSLGEK
jgi:hypothetical protein